MDMVSEAISCLQPVSFHYRKELDPDSVPQFGLVAEEVARVNPDLVVTDEAGKPFTVRYEEVNAMLLNEFLKTYHRVEALETTVAELKKMLKAQSTQLQQVNEKLRSKVVSAVVAEN